MDITSGFSYWRLEKNAGKTLEEDLVTLTEAFTRITDQCYPRKIKRKQCIPMLVHRETRLYEWESISRWGKIVRGLVTLPDAVALCLQSKQANELLPCLKFARAHPDLVTSIQFSGRAPGCYADLKLAYLPTARLRIELDFPSAVNVKQVAKLTEFFDLFKLTWPCFSDVKLEFQEEPSGKSLAASFVSQAGRSSPLQREVTDSGNMEALQESLPQLLVGMAKIFPQYEEWYFHSFTQHEIVEASEFYCEQVGTHALLFTVHPHEGFHPDQLWGEVPTEGFWQIPLFNIRPGRSNESSATVFLIQSLNERFFEVQTADPHSAEDFRKYLENQPLPFPVIAWDGPNDDRWGLSQLKKKMNSR